MQLNRVFHRMVVIPLINFGTFMKIFAVLFVMLSLISTTALARDDVGNYSIEETMVLEKVTSKLGSDVKFYFGDQPYGETEKTMGEFSTNKKTNAFNKSDKEACQWVFLSAMLALKSRAIREGGDAVVNIKSNYKSKEFSSMETFQCGAGAIMAGVALKGTVVKLK